MKEKLEKEEALHYLNIVVLFLSVYVLTALLIDTFFKLPPEISKLLAILDDCICVFFLFEFCVRYYHAESKKRFMRWGWIDLISSIPAFPFLRFGRALRLIRILRILRAFRSVRHLVNHVFRNKAKGAFTSIAMMAVLMMIFASIAILQVEQDPTSNIKTAEDALWWSYVTVTTVGYDDKFPVTTEGRIIASFLIVAGKALFITFMGYIASWFVKEDKKEDNEVPVDELVKLDTLKSNGAITEEEFNVLKGKLLNTPS